MPPTLANGKICYIEMPATEIAPSANFYKRCSAGPSGNAVMVALLLTIRPAK